MYVEDLFVFVFVCVRKGGWLEKKKKEKEIIGMF